MKVIIAGSRYIQYRTVVKAIQESGWEKEIAEVISLTTIGAAGKGAVWASLNNVPVNHMGVTVDDWAQHRNNADIVRDRRVGEYADALILVWDGHDSYSRSTLDLAKQYNLKIHEHVVKPRSDR